MPAWTEQNVIMLLGYPQGHDALKATSRFILNNLRVHGQVYCLSRAGVSSLPSICFYCPAKQDLSCAVGQ